MYRAIRDIIKDQQTIVLESGLVWDYVKAGLQGEDIPGKALSCETPEFGTISQKEITHTLEHIFGVKTKKSHGSRKLIFDISKLKRLGNVYDLAAKVKVVEGDNEDNNRGADMTDWTDVGLGKYVASKHKRSRRNFGNQNF